MRSLKYIGGEVSCGWDLTKWKIYDVIIEKEKHYLTKEEKIFFYVIDDEGDRLILLDEELKYFRIV